MAEHMAELVREMSVGYSDESEDGGDGGQVDELGGDELGDAYENVFLVDGQCAEEWVHEAWLRMHYKPMFDDAWRETWYEQDLLNPARWRLRSKVKFMGCAGDAGVLTCTWSSVTGDPRIQPLLRELSELDVVQGEIIKWLAQGSGRLDATPWDLHSLCT